MSVLLNCLKLNSSILPLVKREGPQDLFVDRIKSTMNERPNLSAVTGHRTFTQLRQEPVAA